jgi:hypothetical protein
MTAGTYEQPIAWGAGTLPYACDDCRQPAVVVRPGDNDNTPDHCWCDRCWQRRYAGRAA